MCGGKELATLSHNSLDHFLKPVTGYEKFPFDFGAYFSLKFILTLLIRKSPDFLFLQILKLLISRTMQLNDVDSYGETALHLASRHGHIECIKLLAKYTRRDAADIRNIRNSDDQTPLHLAVIRNQP